VVTPSSTDRDTGLGVRRPLLGAALAALVFLALLASASDALPWASGFDLGVHSWLVAHRTAALAAVAAVITSTASSAFTAPLVFVVAALLTRGHLRVRLVRAGLVLAVMLSAVLCRYGISELIARPRPPTADWVVQAGGLSFPSGHTSDGALAAGLIAWLVVRRFTGRLTSWVAWPIAAAYALLIAWTRVYLGVHWPTDVFGSLAFVTAWLSGSLVLQRLEERETST
jgi:undecaprenyl-diphosphatase